MNQLQKELFSKMYDLLMDSPRRLTYEDAEMATRMALEEAFNVKSKVILAEGKDIHQALVHWAWMQGWNRTCLVDVLHETPKGDFFSHVTFEVAHETRARYIAIIKKDWITNKVSIIEVKKT